MKEGFVWVALGLLLLAASTEDAKAHGSSHPKWQVKYSMDGIRYQECRRKRYAIVDTVYEMLRPSLFSGRERVPLRAIPTSAIEMDNLLLTNCEHL